MEQYIPNYTDRTAVDIQHEINNNLEYRIIKKPVNGVKAFMPHQIIFAREMLIQKRMICCHPMGSGKTCSIYYAARVALEKNFINGVIFVSPKTVLPQAKEQFTTKCPSANGDVSLFTFLTIDKFLEMTTNETNRVDFSGKMLIIDEAHNRLPNKYRAKYNLIDTDKKRSKKENNAHLHWDMMKTAILSSAMTILATGTFVVNNVVETIALADAISPVEINYKEYVDSTEKYLTTDGRNRFELLTKNMFSYIDPKSQMPRQRTIGEKITVRDGNESFDIIIDKIPMREVPTSGDYPSVDPAYPFTVGAHYTLSGENESAILTNLKEISPKHHRVLELAELPGVSIIYLEDVNNEGIVFYAALLLKMRYKFYDGKSDITTKEKRFTMITGGTKEKDIKKILETHNSPENWNGDFIKIFFISHAARDGISIFYAMRIIMGMCPWHIAGYDQAKARGIRADSHIIWKLRKKQELIGEGYSEEDAQRTVDKFKVEIYNVVHYPTTENTITIDQSRHIPDLRRLVICFQKKHYNSDIISLVHSNSIECNLLKHLNISYTNYDCSCEREWNPVASMTTYNSMFLEEDADLRIQELKSAGYMQPTRIPLVNTLTLEKILETSISKRTPAGIQCFEDSDGRTSFSSYFYSLGFSVNGLWNDDFYTRNSSFVHDSCKDIKIFRGKSTQKEYIEAVKKYIDNSTIIANLTEYFISINPNNFNIVRRLFPEHVFRTSSGTIFHKFIPTNRERLTGYFEYPYVTVFYRGINEWIRYVYSDNNIGIGMGKRSKEFKETFKFSGNTWQILRSDGTTKIPMDSLEKEIVHNVFSIMEMYKIVKEKYPFAIVTDDSDVRVVNSRNSSGKLITGNNLQEIAKELKTRPDVNSIVKYFARNHRLMELRYNVN